MIDRIINYLFWQKNPLVQIVYFACAFGGFYIYVEYGFIHLPGKYIDYYHVYPGSILMILCYAAYFAACWVDPGTIND